jgi:hypothetical protein
MILSATTLLAAILMRLFRNTQIQSGERCDWQGRFLEVEKWIVGGGNWIFSFDNLCELLGLDPEYVRRGLREIQFKAAQDEKPVHRGMRRRAA